MKVYVLTGMPPYEGRIYNLGVYGSIESLEEAKEYYESHHYHFVEWDEFEVE